MQTKCTKQILKKTVAYSLRVKIKKDATLCFKNQEYHFILIMPQLKISMFNDPKFLLFSA